MKRYIAVVILAVATLITPMAPAYACSTPDTVLGIPAWYKGMQDGECNFTPRNGDDKKIDIVKTALLIGLNVLQAALVIAGYVAVFMIIRGGFTYMLSTGSSDGMSSAKKIITNALIGLVISLLAAAIVGAVAGLIK